MGHPSDAVRGTTEKSTVAKGFVAITKAHSTFLSDDKLLQKLIFGFGITECALTK